MAKQLNVNLSFNADTSQAKAQIQALSKSLQDIAKMPGNASNLFDDTQIRKASQAALELQQHLSKAVNVDTGKLDLSRFSSSLKTSNKDLSVYCNTLLSTGEKGQQAFLQLAQAIATADTPVTRINKKLAEMGTTLKNTARWQISSSILHGFMGAVQSAYGYAQDLNASLNDIRIVTGQNIEQMSKFAVEANRAAKALSTTTTEYTDASLIYYQQGLSDSEVAKRTEVTIKMANAAGQSAQIVSDQLTAIWNNFYDGSKSLEYYADVMTALGAATASSTDEIAGGLEKFAAIGETIGLSYEYAASALATITSNTRQSEEVVGTALKTIFARIQGLNLGETLDDGTTLNKYSQALQSVGISIFDQAGELKNMDNILNEMADKWDTLSKAQQAALAQTVAGTRQYTQLIALMDNWDNGDNDSMTANLNTAYGSEGALQEQADIYAESWEAAQDRVRAAAENIYDSLINDEFFIDLLNGFEHVLESVGGLVDGLGGLKGVIGVIGSIFLTNFAQKMPATLENLRQNLMVFTGQAQKEMIKVQDQMSAKMAVQAAAPDASDSFKMQAEGIQQVTKMKQQLVLESKNLTTQEREAYEARIKNVEAMYDEAVALAKIVEEQKKKSQATMNDLAKNASKDAQDLVTKRDKAGDQRDSAERIKAAASEDNNHVEMERQAQAAKKAQDAMDDYNAKINDMIKTYKELGVVIEEIDLTGDNLDPEKAKKMSKAVKDLTDRYKEQITQWKQLDVLQGDMSSQVNEWKKYASEIDKSEDAIKDLKVSMQSYRDTISQIAQQNDAAFDPNALAKLDAVLQNPTSSATDCAEAFEKFKNSVDKSLTDKIDALGNSIEKTDNQLDNLGLSTDGLKQMRQSTEEAAEGVTKLALSTGNIKGQVDQGIESTFKMSVAMTQFGSSIMSVSSMLNSITSAINVFKDEGASGFEKFGAAVSILTSTMGAFNAIQALSTTLTKTDLVTKIAAAAGYKIVKTASGGLTLAKVSETGAVIANTAAWYANPVMWIALVIIGVVVAIIALVSWIIKMNNALTSAEQKLKDAQAATEGMAEAADKAEEKYQDLLSTINNYDSAIKKIEELTEGTNEFTSALLTANGYAQDLIDKYNLLPDDYYIGENGAIQFKTGVLDNAIEAERENVETSNALLMGSQINLNNAQRDVDAQSMGDGYGYSYFGENEDWLTSIELDEYQVADIYQRILAAGYKNVADFNVNADEATKKDIISRGMYGDEYVDEGWVTDDQLDILSTIIDNFTTGMSEYEKLYVDNEIKNEGLIKQNVINSISDEKAYQNSDYKDFIIDQTATQEKYQVEKARAVEAYNNMAEDAVQEAFQNALGDSYIYEDGKVYNKNEDGTKGEVNENLSDLSIDQMKDFLASGDAVQALEESGVALANKINSITKNLSEEDQKIAKAFLSGDTSKLSKEDIEKFKGVENFEGLVALYPELANLEDLGPEVINTLFGNFTAAIENWEPPKIDLAQATSDFNDVQKIISDIKFGDIISQEEFDKLGNEAENYFTRMADGTYKLTGDAEAFYETISNSNKDKLYNQITAGIDYGAELQIDKANAEAALGGMSIDTIGQSQYDAETNTYSGNNVKDQINFALEMGTISQEDATSWLADLNDGSGSFEAGSDALYKIAEAADAGATKYRELTAEIEANNKAIENSIQAAYMSASSVDELDQINNEILDTLGEGVDTSDQYAQGLISLASQYENCSEEVKDYQKALASNDQKTIQAAKDALTLSTRVGELSKKYDLNADVLETQVKLLKQNANNAKLSDKQLVEMAAANQRMNKGIATLNKNWKSWSDTLKNSSEDSMDYAEALTGMTDALVEITGALDASAIPIDFFDAATESGAEHLDWMARAAEGDVQAINLLGNAVGAATVSAMTFSEEMANAAIASGQLDSGFDTTAFEQYRSTVLSGITSLQEAIQNGTLEAGQSVDDILNSTGESWVESLNAMALATGMSVSEMNSLLNQLGVQAKVDVKEVEQEMQVPTYTEYSQVSQSSPGTKDPETGTWITPPTWSKKTWTVPGPSETVTGTVQVAQISTEDGNVGAPQVTWTGTSGSVGGGGVSSGSTGGNKGGGGGGGSKSKPAEPSKKKDIVQRYKEVEDKLDDIREEADRTRSSLDRLYGAEHEAAIQRLLELEQQEIDLLKEKEQEAQNYLQEDLKELKTVSAEVDVEFKFDDKGNIENYEEEMTELYEELAEIQRKAGDEWDENEQKEIDALNEKIQKLEEAMAAYEETRELLEDINAELDAFKGKPALPLITSDTLDIYWEINDALDDIDEQIKDLERKAEGLSGEEKLKVLEEINRLEQERVAILQQQAEINQKDIEEKRAALDKLAELNGLQFEYDENGNIANYQEQMGILQAQLDELHAKKAADGLSPVEEEAMNSIIAKMQELADLAGDYRDAVEESEDILNEIEDTLSGMVADPFVRSDFVDIFKETNDQLDDIDRKISKLQNEADKLTGEARRKKLNEIVTLERKRVEILEHQALIAKTEMEDRKRAMEEIAARQELMFEYDENQNITNYQEQLDVLIDKYEKAYNEALGDDGLIDATEQAILDAISDDIDHLEEFIQAYCDAVEQLEDIEDEREEIANGGYVDMSQLDDIADELHDINQSLDDLQELLDDSSRAADRLYGAARIKQMEKNASLLQQEIDLLQQKKVVQDDIITDAKKELDEKTGGYIKYDEYGRITNYDSYIKARDEQIRQYEQALQEGGLTETEAQLLQEEIDLLQEQKDLMDAYDQALEDKEDIQNQIEDAYYEWQDLNAEKLQYKLELQLDVNDRELAKIERAIQRLDGNFYSRAEALALMVGGGMNGDSKLGNYNKQLADLEAHYQEVKRQYEAGEISQAKYVEMTKELQAEIESTADAMAALQDQMDSYYKDTLAQARQELNFHISQLTHLTGILNHFKNTLTALGKSKDYEMMGTVLEGQVQALENEVKASKNAMQMWQKEADSIYQKYQQALSSGNQENADMYYNAYKEALSAANEAENKFYQQSAAWANALRALMENTLAGLAQDLENALTGGTSFDTITTQMKRASSLQEEYLTTTNKIYETTKLMRTAQQEIDKTTNSVAKQKLSQFITETKQMQSQNKLSKYELSIQQAKYDLLVAEIALEEARFAKSTVRLRRDSEGNFGYIYTADAEAIATAEQKFEDAQNKLYNIGLDGANKYTEKYQQTLAEMYNTLTSLQTKYLQGGFESEAEYNAAVLEAKEYYYEKLNQYSELYSVAINAESGTLTDTLVNNSGIVTDALTKNSRIAADAWSTDFADMTTKTDQWMVAVTDYLSQVQNAFADWEVESQRIANETVGTDLTTLKNKVSDIVTESDNLTAAIGDENSGVIKAIYDEIKAVSGLVTEYANLNGQLTQAIQNAQDLSDALQQDIDQAGQDENPPGQYAPGEEESQKPGTVVPEGTDPMDPIETPQDPPHEHYYVKSKTSPTCTEKGYTTYTCSCGDTYDGDYVDALGHNYTSKVIEEATYERGNLIRYTCQRCGDTYEEYDDNKLPKPKEEGSGEVTKPVEPIKPEPTEPTKPAEPVKPDNSDKVEGVAAAIWMDGSDVSGWGTGNTRKNRLKEKGVSKAQDYINKHAENGDIYAAWHNKRSQLKQYYYGKFDTGGYTGAWGPEGKWAMLHEKEIVLNKEDTKNFLASLELLDNILRTIDLHAMNSQWTPYLASPGISNIGKEALEQMVTIEANFPNATDKYEIEEAFKDLVNLASQYANRK